MCCALLWWGRARDAARVSRQCVCVYTLENNSDSQATRSLSHSFPFSSLRLCTNTQTPSDTLNELTLVLAPKTFATLRPGLYGAFRIRAPLNIQVTTIIPSSPTRQPWRTTRRWRRSARVSATFRTPMRHPTHASRPRHLRRRLQSARLVHTRPPHRRPQENPSRSRRRRCPLDRHSRNQLAQGNARPQRSAPTQHCPRRRPQAISRLRIHGPGLEEVHGGPARQSGRSRQATWRGRAE